MLELRQHFSTPRKLDSTPQHKNIPSEGCNRSSPQAQWPPDLAIRTGNSGAVMDLWFLILPDFLLLCLEFTVTVPEKKTSCFSNEVPSEAV